MISFSSGPGQRVAVRSRARKKKEQGQKKSWTAACFALLCFALLCFALLSFSLSLLRDGHGEKEKRGLASRAAVSLSWAPLSVILFFLAAGRLFPVTVSSSQAQFTERGLQCFLSHMLEASSGFWLFQY